LADRSSLYIDGERSSVEVLHEDNHILAVFKPAGLPVQKDRSNDQSLVDLAKAYIKRRYERPGNVFATAVHRIDRPASGVVLMARTSKAAGRLAGAFREGRVSKTYLAVVEGTPPERSQRLEGWILKDRSRNTSRMVADRTPGARHASLTYRLLGRFGAYSLLEVGLKTGRSHQIRVQLAGIGIPVAGDVRYGSREGFGHIIGLHAASLRFPHPTRGEEICLCARPPRGWRALFGVKLGRAAERACDRLCERGRSNAKAESRRAK